MKHRKMQTCALLLALCLLIGGLSGCGGKTEDTAQTISGGSSGSAYPSGEREASDSGERGKLLAVSLPGTWVLVMIESDGLQMTGDAFEDAAGGAMVITLEEDGTGELTYTYSDSDTDSESEELTWTRESNTLTLTPTDTDSAVLTTELGNNCFTMEAEGMSMTFAKEGTDATSPTLYLDDSAEPFIGTWKSQTVRIDGGKAQKSIDGSAVSGMIQLTLNDDLSAEISSTFGEEPINTACWWAVKDGMAILTDDDLDFSLTSEDDSTLLLTLGNGDSTYEFICERAED